MDKAEMRLRLFEVCHHGGIDENRVIEKVKAYEEYILSNVPAPKAPRKAQDKAK